MEDSVVVSGIDPAFQRICRQAERPAEKVVTKLPARGFFVFSFRVGSLRPVFAGDCQHTIFDLQLDFLFGEARNRRFNGVGILGLVDVDGRHVARFPV